MSDLTKRLRGKYSVGPDGAYEDRDFGSFTPAICNEAADRINELEKQLAESQQELGMMEISLEYKARHLEQCESALESRDKQLEESRKDAKL